MLIPILCSENDQQDRQTSWNIKSGAKNKDTNQECVYRDHFPGEKLTLKCKIKIWIDFEEGQSPRKMLVMELNKQTLMEENTNKISTENVEN